MMIKLFSFKALLVATLMCGLLFPAVIHADDGELTVFTELLSQEFEIPEGITTISEIMPDIEAAVQAIIPEFNRIQEEETDDEMKISLTGTAITSVGPSPSDRRSLRAAVTADGAPQADLHQQSSSNEPRHLGKKWRVKVQITIYGTCINCTTDPLLINRAVNVRALNDDASANIGDEIIKKQNQDLADSGSKVKVGALRDEPLTPAAQALMDEANAAIAKRHKEDLVEVVEKRLQSVGCEDEIGALEEKLIALNGELAEADAALMDAADLAKKLVESADADEQKILKVEKAGLLTAEADAEMKNREMVMLADP